MRLSLCVFNAIIFALLEIDEFFLLPLRYGMLYRIRKQWRLFLQHHIKKKQLKSWLNAPYVNGRGRKVALLWMTCQLFASSFTPSLPINSHPLKLLINKNNIMVVKQLIAASL